MLKLDYLHGMSLVLFLVEGLAGAVAGAKIGKTAGPLEQPRSWCWCYQQQHVYLNLIARQQEQVERGNLDSINEAALQPLHYQQAALESALYPVLGKLFGPLSRTQFSNVLNRATTR